MTEKRPRKRLRPTKVCTFCRKRKVKCNLQQPCNNCIKYMNPVCEYELTPGVFSKYPHEVLVAPTQVLSELETLKKRLHVLEGAVDPAPAEATRTSPGGPQTLPLDTVNFNEGYLSIYDREPWLRRHYPPLQWVLLIKTDLALLKLWDYATKLVPLHLVRPQYLNKTGNENAMFCDKATSDESHNDGEIYGDPQRNARLREQARTLGVSFFEQGFADDLELADKIRLVLPRRRAIWLLVDRFFANVYFSMPVLDEHQFRTNIARLVGPPSTVDEPLVLIGPRNRLDFAYLGQLLIVLRFLYLLLFTNLMEINYHRMASTDALPQAQDLKYLLNHPVDIDVANMARLCLGQFNLLRLINLAIMQLAMLTRYYHQYAPEEGDGLDGGDSQVALAMLVQMARGLGLHREPDVMPNDLNDVKMNHLGRKIWYLLVVMEYTLRLNDGSQPQIALDLFDTKVPWFTTELALIANLELEQATVGCLAHFAEVMELMLLLLTMVSQVKGAVRVNDLWSKLAEMELHVSGLWFSHQFLLLAQLYDSNLLLDQRFRKLLGVKVYFNVTFVTVLIWFILFNHYEQRCNPQAAFWYLKEIIQRTICDMMPYFYGFVNRPTEIFADTTDLFVTPAFELTHHKGGLVLTLVFIRCQFVLRNLRALPTHDHSMQTDDTYRRHYDKLTETVSLVRQCISVLKSNIQRLSSRYYYAWRIHKGQSFLENLAESDQFYEPYLGRNEYCELRFTYEMLTEINGMLREAVDRVHAMELPPEEDTLLNLDEMWLQMLKEKGDRGTTGGVGPVDPGVENQDLDFIVNNFGLAHVDGQYTDFLDINEVPNIM